MDESSAVIALVGINLQRRGPLAPSKSGTDVDRRQLAERFQLIELERLASDDPEWMSLLHAREKRLLLLRGKPGDLTQRCAEEIWKQTQGAIGVTFNLINIAANTAILDGSERITQGLLKKVAPTVRVAIQRASQDVQ